jgi:tetratricopeptide (TPR) repeat protein
VTPPGASGPVAPAKTARDYIDRATKSFQAGNYQAAIDDYYAAYQLKSLSQILFNIAQTHRKAGQTQEALSIYERFLREDPKSPLVPEAEAHAAAMRARLEAEKASAERESAERLAKQRADEADALAKAREEERKKAEAALLLATTKKKPDPLYKKGWFWGVIGGVVVAAAVGVGVGVALRPHDPDSDLGLRVVKF